MKSHENESIPPIALSPNISSMRPEVHNFLSAIKKKSDFLHAVAIQAGPSEKTDLCYLQ